MEEEKKEVKKREGKNESKMYMCKQIHNLGYLSHIVPRVLLDFS
jgi:hypothetical protein